MWVITEQERVVYSKVLNGEIVFSRSDITAFLVIFAHISQLGGIEIETVEDRAMLSRLGVSNVQKRHNEWRRGNSCKKIAAAFFPTSTWHSSG
uniref:ABC-F type ribosomal protection protein n=1 Tax=Klebsiella pneumoniae TaxID=573 RepID=A0A8B0T083_KLEPN|nr:ABC-F type ribosomal protection protein [Klebsiella pneumoniae]